MSRLAAAFDESWNFERDGDRTHVVRSFEMHPKSALTRPLLWQHDHQVERIAVRPTLQRSDHSQCKRT
jgi:hypothetical protein